MVDSGDDLNPVRGILWGILGGGTFYLIMFIVMIVIRIYS